MIRPATIADTRSLIALESESFTTDRLTARQFRYLLTRAKAETLVEEEGGEVRGYVAVLFSRATSAARLFSIAVASNRRGRGIGRRLVEAAERGARRHDKAYVRLEIRVDNLPSQRLFEGLGYRRFALAPDYYEDHEEALRYEKCLAPGLRPELARVPFYGQTLDFTCGPSSLLMAMKALRPDTELSRAAELRIWRDATTIFMTSGLGGCSPQGLALAAHRRGFHSEVYVNEDGPPLIQSVRDPQKKEVMRLVHEDMTDEAKRVGVRIRHGTLGVAALKARFDGGSIPLVLISSHRIYGERSPHWVVVTGIDQKFVYVNDPFVDHEEGETAIDSINMPIEKREFARMARYGRSGLQAVVLVRNDGPSADRRHGARPDA